MADKQALDILAQGSAEWNSWRAGKNAPKEPDLSNADLKERDLSGFNLRGANLREADLEGAVLRGSVLRRTDLRGAKLSRAHCQSANFGEGKLASADLRECDLSEAHLGHADLSQSDLRQADLRRAVLDTANLTASDLRGARIDRSTSALSITRVDGCRIDKIAVASLDENTLTPGQRSIMRIEDPVATLKMAYGGFWQWIHGISLAVFALPYLWFIGSRWAEHHLSSAEIIDTIPLWKALCYYVWSGGLGWTPNAPFAVASFSSFCVVFAYNVLRVAMLWRTKTLELEETVREAPTSFLLQGVWGRMFWISKWVFYVNLAAVVVNSLHFFATPIPVR